MTLSRSPSSITHSRSQHGFHKWVGGGRKKNRPKGGRGRKPRERGTIIDSCVVEKQWRISYRSCKGLENYIDRQAKGGYNLSSSFEPPKHCYQWETEPPPPCIYYNFERAKDSADDPRDKLLSKCAVRCSLCCLSPCNGFVQIKGWSIDTNVL